MELKSGQDGQMNTDEKGILLSEKSLWDLSKSFTRLIPRSNTEVDADTQRYCRSLQNDLLRTASSSNLSLNHGTAAINALCSFIDQCISSPQSQLHSLPFETESWIQSLQIFLLRAENGRAKPLRRLLLTLTDLLMKHPLEGHVWALSGYAIQYTTSIIRKQEESGSVKAAMQVLEHFLAKALVNTFEIVQFTTLQDFEWGRKNPQARQTDASKISQMVEQFTGCVLDWVQYPDCVPAAGRFLSAYFKSLGQLGGLGEAFHASDVASPLWLKPVRQSLIRHPHLLEVYENQILPGLLSLSSVDRQAFLRTLPLNDIQNGITGKRSVADIQFCLLAVRLDSCLGPSPMSTISSECSDEGVVDNDKEIKHAGPVKPPSNSKCTKIDVIQLATSLLKHSSGAVRISALSLLISYPVSMRYFSSDSLRVLRRCLPYYHREVTPKARNEFIALVKKLWRTLKAAITFLRRVGEISAHENPDHRQDAETTPSEQPQDGAAECLSEHHGFRSWYLHFLFHELRPTSSYQSHITALKVLDLVFIEQRPNQAYVTRVTLRQNEKSKQSLHNDQYLRPLLDLLLDPFDDVRQAADSLIQLLFLGGSSVSPEGADEQSQETNDADDACHQHFITILLDALQVAESRAAETGRADHADGVGRLYNLLYSFSSLSNIDIVWYDNASLILEHLISKLEKEAEIAQRDLRVAVRVASLHGHLIALRHITSRSDYWTLLASSTSHASKEWGDFNQRILNLCDCIWEAVRAILCFDAPEGTDATEEEIDDQDIGTKDTLSYCWRALKESSSLLHSIVSNSGYSSSPSQHSLNCLRPGRLSQRQLNELRHRGAFSTVSTTFAACCTACAHSSILELQRQPQEWYQEALTWMAQHASALTRRSAGLPAIVTGILAAYPEGEFFNNVLLDLQGIADGPVSGNRDIVDARLPQVHALNCMKDIFTDSRFGIRAEVHMAVSLEIATSCLESHIWAIRNCGLMLFKALLRRLNGGTDTASTKVSSSHRASSQLVYQQYPNLQELLLRLLDTNHCSQSDALNGKVSLPATRAQSIFAAFEVIERSGIPPAYAIKVRDALWYYAASSDWSLREKAAKALSQVLDVRDVEKAMASLLPYQNSQNLIHGRLLCLRFVLSQISTPLVGEALDVYQRLLSVMNAHFKNLVVRNSCPITVATFLDCLAELYKILVHSRSSVAASYEQICQEEHLVSAKSGVADPAWVLPRRACARLSMLILYVKHYRAEAGQVELSERSLKAMDVLDETQQFTSDENVLAILKYTPGHDSSHIRRALRYADWCRDEKPEREQWPNNPLKADCTLALLGCSMGVKPVDDDFLPHKEPVAIWARMLHVAGAEQAELRTRFAAAFSLRSFFEIRLHDNQRPSKDSEMLDVYLALYNTLVDDDEDIRDQGATATSFLLSSDGSDHSNKKPVATSLSPPAAKRRLLNFLQEGYHNSSALYLRAIEKLTGLQIPSIVEVPGKSRNVEGETKLCQVAAIFAKIEVPQLAVFFEEKQNLYVDAVEEAQVWAEVLLGLDDKAWNDQIAAALDLWTQDGLVHFIDTFKKRSDGPLGLMSQPEIYTLLVRVVLLGKVLMSRPAPAEGPGIKNINRRLMEELLDMRRISGLHSLLINHIESILD